MSIPTSSSIKEATVCTCTRAESKTYMSSVIVSSFGFYNSIRNLFNMINFKILIFSALYKCTTKYALVVFS